MLDKEAEEKLEELADEMHEAYVVDQTIRYYEGGIVRSVPTGAAPEYITVEIEGIYDENVDWRGVPASLVVGDEVLVWENPISHRREIAGGSGATGTSTASPWQKVTVAPFGADFALLSAAIAWINALAAPIAPAATRLFAVNLLGGNFAEAADVTVPQYVHVGGEGEGTEIEMGAFTLIMSSDTSLMNVVVESSDPVDAIRMNGASNVILRDVRCIQGAAADCFHVLGASSRIELYGCIAEAGTGNAIGFHIGGTASALLEYCQADDTTNFVDALLLDAAACTATTKWSTFHGTSGGDDVDTGAGSTWNHFDCQVDPNNVTIAGAHHALPTKRFNQEVIIAEEGGDFQELSEAIAWINAQGDAAANKLYGIRWMVGNYSEGAGVTIPQYVHVTGEGEGTSLDMGNFTLTLADDTSLECVVVTSTGTDQGWVIDVDGDDVEMRDVRIIATSGATTCLRTVTNDYLAAYHVVCEATTTGCFGFYFDDSVGGILWDCEADHTNFDTALYIDNNVGPADVTTKFCELTGHNKTDTDGDVVVIAGGAWRHFCCQFDPDNCSIAGTELPQTHGKTNFDDEVTFEDGIMLEEMAAAPGNVANAGWLYTKDVAGVTEAFYEDDTGAETQLTLRGALGGITLLGSAVVDTQNGDGKTTVYTVPAGKSAVITHVVIHSPSASLAGGTDYDLGSGGACNTWRQTISLTTMTAVTDYMVIPSIAAVPVKYTLEPAAATFGVLPITGSVLDTTATMDVFGYLV